VTDDPNSVADAPTPEDVLHRNRRKIARNILNALTAAGYEVVPAGTADRLAALTDAIDDPQWLRDGASGDFYEGWSDYLRRIADAAAAAVQPPEPRQPTRRMQ
jgi:hypothetical protein